MSFSDDFFSPLICALIVQWTRRFLDTKTRLPDWDYWLGHLWTVFGVSVGFAIAFKLDFLYLAVWLVALPMLAYTAWLLWDYQPARSLFMGLLPFVFLNTQRKILAVVAPGFHKDSDSVYELLMLVSVVWLVASIVFANRQKKEAVRREAELAVEAEKRRQAEARKMELEYLVSERTAEITRQKEELQHALAELKATQDQLVQREKLASLGELTAGIAHEIQNPLNFVNNFSEVSAELIAELQEEREKGDQRDQELEAELLDDLAQNLQKITHHGQRASGIIRSMLQHSRANTGQREPIDINDLADEYLKLSYHGLRAKDKSFNARFEMHADPSVGKISIIPQDIGRVLLNLYNNAFYAVQQRSKNLTGLEDRPTLRLQGLPGYQPTVIVTTQCLDGRVRISVADNGMGMPDEVKAKIFQPFFTTKPTGEGTGLGLSLSYDIITKGHGGTITVESREGQGTQFIIELPA